LNVTSISANSNTNLLTIGNASQNIAFPYANVGIATSAPAYPLDVAGNIRVTGIYNTSDRRIKENIQPFTWGEHGSLISQLQIKRYFNIINKKEEIGLIADEVQKLFPELVNCSTEPYSDNLLSINYTSLLCLLIHELQEIKRKLDIINQ
jgi:hypothetical protein